MSTSPSSAPSPSTSKGCFDKSAYYSSLPWFRSCLAMLNWRPVVDYELREIEFDRREIEFEKRKIAHEQRMKQLRSENERLAELNVKLSAILFSSDTSSTPPNAMPGESEM
ncbi:hypothetical protein [Synechococcus sp. 8F6]|uniref:hypothetical protein n=1 Tax=Synechococcus sp. 8F6 TaxID=2025606 RepID=UPI0011808309|nr:hypothetical protein [Synechococcus sp. 8F6]